MAPPKHRSRLAEMVRGTGYFAAIGLSVLLVGWLLAAVFTWLMS